MDETSLRMTTRISMPSINPNLVPAANLRSPFTLEELASVDVQDCRQGN